MAAVELAAMRQLAEARCKDDDWTGLKDKSERRKRQTRLALRALRMLFPTPFHAGIWIYYRTALFHKPLG